MRPNRPTKKSYFASKIMYEIWHKTPILNGARGTIVNSERKRQRKIPVCNCPRRQQEKLLNFSFLMFTIRRLQIARDFHLVAAASPRAPDFFFNLCWLTTLPRPGEAKEFLFAKRSAQNTKRKIVLISFIFIRQKQLLSLFCPLALYSIFLSAPLSGPL